MMFKKMKKIDKIKLLRLRLPSNILSTFPWCENDKVVYSYFSAFMLNIIAKSVNIYSDTNI